MPRSRLILSAVVLLAGGVARAATSGTLADGLYAEITTPRGVITCELTFQKTPLTVASFVGLAEGVLGPAPRKPFFDGLTFHRVVPDFVVQGGDPTGTGDGGPGYQFADEFVPGLRHDSAGVLSMANDGPDTNGSQFFLTLRETNRLNYLHSVFGHVVSGSDALARIQPGDKMTVKILRVGSAAKAFRADEATFRALATRARKYTDVARANPEPGPDAHFDDAAKLLPAEPPRAKYFNYKLANLERATGLRIVARVFAKSPSPSEDAQPGAFMRGLAQKFGAAERGAFVAYFADEDDWRVWVGDELAGRFAGAVGNASELTKSGAMHEAKEAFLEAAQAKGAADYEKQKSTLVAGRQPPPAAGQKIKLQMDAILDGLIFKLEPH